MKSSSSSLLVIALTLVLALLGSVAVVVSRSSDKDTKTLTVVTSSASSLIRRQLQSLSIRGNNGSPGSAFPLGECQGDCDRDSECASGLVCLQRNGNENVPGCSGSARTGIDYCIRSGSSGGGGGGGDSSSGGSSLSLRGDDRNPSSAFPLGKCQGDCDSDNDCAGNLVCYQRRGTETVPGCSGSSSFSGKDFCYERSGGGDDGGDDDDDNNNGGGGGGGGSVLRMYWREGYFWQESTREAFWCMRCDSSSQECADGREIYITNCRSDMTSRWTFVNAGGAYLIKLSASNLCMRAGRWITMDQCNSNDRNQLFNTVGGSPSRGNRFEIRPVVASGACITQSHHPRQGERLGLWDCRIPQRDTTNYWTFY